MKTRVHFFLMVALFCFFCQVNGYTVPIGSKKETPSITYNNYTWRQFNMKYPSTWRLSVDKSVQGSHTIHLENKDNRPIKVTFSMIDNVSKFTKKYQVKPNLAAFAFAFPTMKKILKNNIGNVTVSLNQIQIGDNSAAGVVLMSPLSVESKDFIAIQGFALVKNKLSLAGMIMTEGVKGQIFTNRHYFKAVAEAYGILNSVTIRRRS